jgi:hypothetical protein
MNNKRKMKKKNKNKVAQGCDLKDEQSSLLRDSGSKRPVGEAWPQED